jgi:hypothetical protein
LFLAQVKVRVPAVLGRVAVRSALFISWLALTGALAGCPSPVVQDSGVIEDAGLDASLPPADSGVVPDSGEPEDLGVPDTGTSSVTGRHVSSGSFAPTLGVGSNAVRKVQGRIPPPQSLGTASGVNRTVRGSAEAPR